MKRLILTSLIFLLKLAKTEKIINKTLVIQKDQPRFISAKELLNGREFKGKMNLNQKKKSFLDMKEKGKITKKNIFLVEVEDQSKEVYVRNFKIFQHLNINQKEIGVIELENSVIFYMIEDDKANELFRVKLEDLSKLKTTVKRKIVNFCYRNNRKNIYLVIEVRETNKYGRVFSTLHVITTEENQKEKKIEIHYSKKFKTLKNSTIPLYSRKDGSLLEQCEPKCTIVNFKEAFSLFNYSIIFARYCHMNEEILQKKYPPGSTKSRVEIFSFWKKASIPSLYYFLDNYKIDFFNGDNWEHPEILGIVNILGKVLIFDRKGILFKNKLLMNRRKTGNFRIAYNAPIEKFQCHEINNNEVICSIYERNNSQGKIINLEFLRLQNSFIYLNPKTYTLKAEEILSVINYKSYILALCRFEQRTSLHLINKNLDFEVKNFNISENYETLKMRNYQLGFMGEKYLEGHAAILIRDKNTLNKFKMMIFQITQPYFKLIPIESNLGATECEYSLKFCSKTELFVELQKSKKIVSYVKVYIIDQKEFSSILALNETVKIDPDFLGGEYLIPLSRNYFGGVTDSLIENYRKVGVDRGRGWNSYHHYKHKISEDFTLKFMDDYEKGKESVLSFTDAIGAKKFYFTNSNDKTSAFLVIYIKTFSSNVEMIYKDFDQVIPEGNSTLSSKKLLTYSTFSDLEIVDFFSLGRVESFPTCLFFANLEIIFPMVKIIFSRFCFEEKKYKIFGKKIFDPPYSFPQMIKYKIIQSTGQRKGYLITVLVKRIIVQFLEFHETEPKFEIPNPKQNYTIELDQLVDIESITEFGYNSYEIVDFKFWAPATFVLKVLFYSRGKRVINLYGFYTFNENSLSISKIGSILRKNKQNSREVLFLSKASKKAALVSAKNGVYISVYDLDIEILRKSTPTIENSFKPVFKFNRMILKQNEKIQSIKIPQSHKTEHIYFTNFESFSIFAWTTTTEKKKRNFNVYNLIFKFSDTSIIKLNKIVNMTKSGYQDMRDLAIQRFTFYQVDQKVEERPKLIFSVTSRKDEDLDVLFTLFYFWAENNLVLTESDKNYVQSDISHSKKVKIPVKMVDLEGLHYEEFYEISPKKGFEILIPGKKKINKLNGTIDLKMNKNLKKGLVAKTLFKCHDKTSKFKIFKNRIKSMICGEEKNELILNPFVEHFYDLTPDNMEIDYKHGMAFTLNKKYYFLILTNRFITFIEVKRNRLYEVLRIKSFISQLWDLDGSVKAENCLKIIDLDNDLKKNDKTLTFELLCSNEGKSLTISASIPTDYLNVFDELNEILELKSLEANFKNMPSQIIDIFNENEALSHLFVLQGFYFNVNFNYFEGIGMKKFFNIHWKNKQKEEFTHLFTSLEDKYSIEEVDDYLIYTFKKTVDQETRDLEYEIEFFLLERIISRGEVKIRFFKVIFKEIFEKGVIALIKKELQASLTFYSPQTTRAIFSKKLNKIRFYDISEDNFKEVSVTIKNNAETGKSKILDLKIQRIFSKKGLCVIRPYVKIRSSDRLIILTCFSSLNRQSKASMLFYEIKKRESREARPDHHNPVNLKSFSLFVPRKIFFIKILKTENKYFVIIPKLNAILSLYKLNLQNYSLSLKEDDSKLLYESGKNFQVDLTLTNRYHTKNIELSFEEPIWNNALNFIRWMKANSLVVIVLVIYFMALLMLLFIKPVVQFFEKAERFFVKGEYRFKKKKKKRLHIYGEVDYRGFAAVSRELRIARYE